MDIYIYPYIALSIPSLAHSTSCGWLGVPGSERPRGGARLRPVVRTLESTHQLRHCNGDIKGYMYMYIYIYVYI